MISAINHQMSGKLRFMCFFFYPKACFQLIFDQKRFRNRNKPIHDLKNPKNHAKNQNQPKNKTKLITVFSQH